MEYFTPQEHEKLLKFKQTLEIADILISLSLDSYNKAKCLLLHKTPADTTGAFYKALFAYTDSKRPLLLTA